VATVSVGRESKVTGSTERDITEMKNKGFTREDLFSAQAKTLHQLKIPNDSPIGYCFSYPAKSLTDGDAELIKWTKGVGIPQMEGKPVGKPLLNYLNATSPSPFTDIKVVNDTITSLFAGLLTPGFDAYIGLIVGTGTNMATFFPSEYIPKIRTMKDWSGETPVNLESGNFYPPHLTPFDDEVDARSDNKGFQRFEKAISGMYLGRVFMAAFPNDKFDEGFSAVDLTRMINNPSQYKSEYAEVAYQIYERSAKLVAASIAGLVKNLKTANSQVKKVQVLAEGSLFWSKIKTGKASYAEMVDVEVNKLVKDLGISGVNVKIAQMENANLIGAAMAVLS
jgi:hexokinase